MKLTIFDNFWSTKEQFLTVQPMNTEVLTSREEFCLKSMFEHGEMLSLLLTDRANRAKVTEECPAL